MEIKRYLFGTNKMEPSFKADTLRFLSVLSLLSMVVSVSPGLPVEEIASQCVWWNMAAVSASMGILLSLFITRKEGFLTFDSAVSWALIIFGGVEAIWGLHQLYGFSASRHSQYALTGSFFNPGPYSGYLAMILPICLHQWMVKLKDNCNTIKKTGKYIPALVGILILCVLPTAMSRSAWLAAGLSCLWVYACHKGWADSLKIAWILHKKKILVGISTGIVILLLLGYLLFILKPTSAQGRLFMWNITCRAIAEKPLWGYGLNDFASAYGNAQEMYFTQGGYATWEEYVAGSPQYAFNEYLQLAVEVGIPLTVCICLIVGICFYIGLGSKRFGICGAILSLAIFSFSSYPMQIPVFVVTLICLLAACVIGRKLMEWVFVAIVAGGVGWSRWEDDRRTLDACHEWMQAKALYNVGAYEVAVKEYEQLYPLLNNREAFLFEYGHSLHKLDNPEASNRILLKATTRSNDPMILNIIGKNCQQMGNYLAAEDWFIRSANRLPGRIYPYYLRAKLYVEPTFHHPEKLREMKRIVLTKEPKVNSTAIRQMRDEIKRLK